MAVCCENTKIGSIEKERDEVVGERYICIGFSRLVRFD